jgi:transcription elongation factor Elf1
MKIKLSATFEGKCDICNKEGIVFTAGDEGTKKAVTVCKECSDKLGEMQLSEAIDKYGKVDEKAFENGVKVDKKGKAG